MLTFSTFAPVLVYAAPLANNSKDWQHIEGNSWGWNYSPQTQINKDNVNQLEVKWIAPIPGVASRPAGLQSISLGEGISAPLLIHGGKVAGVTNFLKTLQYDMVTGQLLWTNDYTVDVTKEITRLPLQASQPLHLHGTRYWEAGNAVLQVGLVCDFYGVDWNTGKTSFRVPDLCLNIPGNVYKYQSQLMGSGEAAIGTWEKGKQFIYGLQGSLQGDFVSGRSLFEGIDMDTKQVVWRVFNQPPQDMADKDWALQECDIGYLVTTSCSKFASDPSNRALLEYDWQAVPGQPPHRLNGVSASWAEPIVDEDTGLMYIQTGNQSPYSNLTSRPGPNLYGSTIMAIDMNAGKRAWWVQPYPHDPYDKDCNWGGMLIDHPKIGKVFVKGCKDGFMYVIDAKTGKPLQRWDAVVESYGENDRSYIIYDPPTKEMLTLPWAGAGKEEVKAWARVNPTTVLLRPGVNDFAGDAAYDGENTIYYKPTAGEWKMQTIDLEQSGAKGLASWIVLPSSAPANTTLVARDLVTGQIKWSYGPFPGAHRVMGDHVVITGGMIIAPNNDGYIYYLDKDTGKLLRKMVMGATMITGASVGQDSAGNTKIMQIVGVGVQMMAGFVTPMGSPSAGTIVAIGLSEQAGGKATTVTTTAVSTSVTTSISTSIATSTTTSATTVTTATTITSSAPTQTVTQSVTQTTGLPSEVTYAAVAVAVIAIIGAAVLLMRKK
ncbi:MAG: hypothetical protein HYY22_03085 [Thaumarchaeota archaeon]|nr:hypothetical protein [Nitrososphaerota archaeon]